MATSARRQTKPGAASATAGALTTARPSAPEQALAKLGLVRDIDLALHLPLRYEDETRIVQIAVLADGDTGQVEGVVSDSRIQFRPRRQLVVRIADDSGELVLRFLHFYPSAQRRSRSASACARAARRAAASSVSRWCIRRSRSSLPARRCRRR
jgi:RecG-like helicase